VHGATRAAVPAVGRAGRLHLPGWSEGRHARDHRGDRTTELTPDTTEETETTAGSTEQQVNDTVEFQDGVKMTVLGLNRNASRSSYAAGGHPGDQTVVATVKVTNGADHPIDLNVTLSLSNGADGIAAEDVFDPDSGYNGIDRPAKLQPGRSATGKFAFAL
jgi:hypothetical protein